MRRVAPDRDLLVREANGVEEKNATGGEAGKSARGPAESLCRKLIELKTRRCFQFVV